LIVIVTPALDTAEPDDLTLVVLVTVCPALYRLESVETDAESAGVEGAFTETLTLAVWVRVPLVPVTITT
jgi:hypothetical protein